MKNSVPQWLCAGLLPGQVAVSDSLGHKAVDKVVRYYGYEVVVVEKPYGEQGMFAAVRQLNLLAPDEAAFGAVAYGEYSDLSEVSDLLLGFARPKMAPEGLVDELVAVGPRHKAIRSCMDVCSFDLAEVDNAAPCFSRAPESAMYADPEDAEERELEYQRREWEDRLSAMVIEYVARFHSVPDFGRLEQAVRGKLSLRNPGCLSAVTVSGDLRIYLPDYNEMELRMTPLARTLYIFFLCHPEGVCLSEIPDYADELGEIYQLVKPGGDENLARASIADITCPFSESLQQKLSLTRRAVRRQIPVPEQAEHYLVKGERGGKYGIDIPAGLRRLPAVLRR